MTVSRRTAKLAAAFLAALWGIPPPSRYACIFCGATRHTSRDGNGVRYARITECQWRGQVIGVCECCKMSLGYSLAAKGLPSYRHTAAENLDQIPELSLAEWAARQILRQTGVRA